MLYQIDLLLFSLTLNSHRYTFQILLNLLSNAIKFTPVGQVDFPNSQRIFVAYVLK